MLVYRPFWRCLKIDIATSPWRLVQNKVKRYPGGCEIDRFRGIVLPVDGDRPEAWVGSDTSAGPVGKGEKSYEGHAWCILPYFSERAGSDFLTAAAC